MWIISVGCDVDVMLFAQYIIFLDGKTVKQQWYYNYAIVIKWKCFEKNNVSNHTSKM